MEKIIVIIARGKGREGADWIKPKLFDTRKDAEKYIESAMLSPAHNVITNL